MEITIATPFSRVEHVPQYLAGLTCQRLPASRLVWLDVSAGTEVEAALRPKLGGFACFKEVVYRHAPQAGAGDGPGKVGRVAAAFRQLWSMIPPGDDIIIAEDDIAIPGGALEALVADLRENPGVDCVGAAQWDRHGPGMLLAWRILRRRVFPAGDPCNETAISLVPLERSEEKRCGLEAVGATATGLMAIRSAIRVSWRAEACMGQDQCLGIDMAKAGRGVALDWGIKTGHVRADGSVVRSPLTDRVEVLPRPTPNGERVEMERRMAAGAQGLAVAVTAHPAYVPWLSVCLASIDAQDCGPAERILVLDGVAEVPEVPAGWTVLRTAAGSPISGRNAALAASCSPWVVHFDADNLMPGGYLAGLAKQIAGVDRRVAILYPDLADHDGDLRPLGVRRWPVFDYWALRRANFIDTSSAWRRTAIEQAGGWIDSGCLDDYGLALRITALGWLAEHAAGPAVIYRKHENPRWWGMHSHGPDAIWQQQTFSIVTLHRGVRKLAAAWYDWLRTADLPPRCTVLAVDDSGRMDFRALLGEQLQQLADQRQTLAQCLSTPHRDLPGTGWTTNYQRHQRVAALLASVVGRPPADCVLSFEDDTIPLAPDSLRRLVNHLRPGDNTGAVGGLYAARNADKTACLSVSPDWWQARRVTDFPTDRASEVCAIGGGFTLYRMGFAVAGLPPRATLDRQGNVQGWDWHLSRAIAAAGGRILVAGDVRCEHRWRDTLP